MRNAARSASLAFAVVCVVGIAGVIAAALDERRLAFTLGVQPALVAAMLQPGDTACQGPIAAPADAGAVRFPVGTGGAAGPPLTVSVRTVAGVAGRATVPAGYRGRAVVNASLPGIEKGRRIALCVRNAGSRPVALYGGPPQASRTSALRLGGRETNTDAALVFERSESTSMLSLLPDAIERATLFKAGWIGEGLLWALAILLVTAVPAALVLGLRAALREPGSGTSYSSRP
jgi:hypothetical protein